MSGGATVFASMCTPSPRTHRVARGETLTHIAHHYDTTVEVLSVANALKKDEPLREGQLLIVPRESETLPARRATTNASWARYVKPPRQRGYLELSTRSSHFTGLAVDERGRLRPAAVRALNDLLGAGGRHPPLPERLMLLMVRVSDTFGGRPIHVVSGYRTNSYYQDSRHKQSAAIDFAIAGVPNAVVRDYLREFEDVGVGFYPNSTFVHLDVRDHSAYWVDYAGPGEPPRSSPNAPALPRHAERKLLAELDDLLEHTTQAMQHAGNNASRSVPKRPVPKLRPPGPGNEQARVIGEPPHPSGRSREPVSL